MSRVWTLTKIFLKTSNNSSKDGKKRKLSPMISMIFLVVILILALGLPFGNMVGILYEQLSAIGQEGLILGIILLMSSVVIFVFGIIYVMGTFYFSKDIEFLLPLPLKPYEITLGKFVTVLIYEYLTEFVVMVIPIIVYGVKSGEGIIYWIFSLIIFIFLPILPLVAAALINMIIMSFTNLGKHKEKLRVIGGILAVFSGVFINIAINSMGPEVASDPNYLVQTLMEGNNSLISIMTKAFPTVEIASTALINSGTATGLINVGIFLMITALSIGLFIFIANSLYFKGVLGGSEVASRRKKLTSEEFSKSTRETSILISYVSKELKMLFRTPTYLVNCVITNFLWPIFLLIPFITQGQSFNTIIEYSHNIMTNGVISIILIVIVNVIFFISSTNAIAATAISREGSNAFFMKYIPVSYKKQLLAKALSGSILSAINIVFLAIFLIVLGAPIKLIISFIIIGIMANLACNLICIMVDLTKPKLKWDNEQMAVKQNFRSFIALMICVAIAGIGGYLLIKLDLEFVLSAVILFIEFGVIILGMLYFIDKKAMKYFDDIS
ncbi:hypothetical protein [Clostridium sp.]|uniref:putative ABC transporter permease subunit n=1 Tax=Clostridium sp. TaxID=1506 RepID=UPI0034646EBA